MPDTSQTGPPSPDLDKLQGSVDVPGIPSFWRRMAAFAGPAYLVSVGYMDPGNWATDIAAGSRFGTTLLWVLLASNGMAILLQSLSARLGIAAGMDLAQASRAMFGPSVGVVLWILAEVAIVACDLAEVLGSGIGLQLLFGIPLWIGVLLTACDAFLLLFLQHKGMRLLEAFIVVLVGTIGVCMGLETVLSRPELGAIASGLVPSIPGNEGLYLAIGILGATVMPHNLYLHSSLVQSRRIRRTPTGIRAGVRFNTIDSVVALNAAFFVNASLLVMAASTFFRGGFVEVASIQQAHKLLEPLLGTLLAPVAFAVALLASGQSSTITGTLAGQIVMEGFVKIRVQPMVRRLITRGLAIIPALGVILLLGEGRTTDLLILSQVVLSLQLSFAVIPLVHATSDPRWMGRQAIRWPIKIAAWSITALIVTLNVVLVAQQVGGWIQGAGSYAWLVRMVVLPITLGLGGLLVYVLVQPVWKRFRGEAAPAPLLLHGPAQMPDLKPDSALRHIAVAVDFSTADGPALSAAVGLARSAGGRVGGFFPTAGRGSVELLLLHVVESGGARLLGREEEDQETVADRARLELYSDELRELGVAATWDLGFGNPVTELALLVRQHRPDLLVVAGHGHRGVADVLHGTTIERLRHEVTVPMLVIPAEGAA
jgi:manganese transport protein